MPSEALIAFAGLSLHDRMRYVRETIARGKAVRGVKMRQPLASVTIITRQPFLLRLEEYRRHVIDELNVKRLLVIDIRRFTDDEAAADHIEFDRSMTPDLVAEGEARQAERERIREAQKAERE